MYYSICSHAFAANKNILIPTTGAFYSFWFNLQSQNQQSNIYSYAILTYLYFKILKEN